MQTRVEVVGQPDGAARLGSFPRWAILIGVGIFATNLGQPIVLDLPLRNLLKDDLGLSRPEMAAFWAISIGAWYLKPLAGLLSDAFPLFGTRRRHYLIFSALLAGLFWLLLGVVPRSYYSLLIAVMALNGALVITSTVVGGLIVDGEKTLGAAGRLVSVRVFVDSVCMVVAGPLAGLLALYAFGVASTVGAAIAFTIVPVALILLREPRRAAYSASALSEAVAALRTLLQSRVVWRAALFIFLVSIPQDLPTVTFYFVRDEMKFPVDTIGWLRSVNGAGALGASLAYAVVAPKLTLRTVLLASIAGVAFALVLYTFYRSLPAAGAIEFVRGFLLTISFLSIMEAAVWATPAGASAMGFALFMSASNLGFAAGDVLGSELAEHAGLQLSALAFIYAGAMTLMLGTVALLPRAVFLGRDANVDGKIRLGFSRDAS